MPLVVVGTLSPCFLFNPVLLPSSLSLLQSSVPFFRKSADVLTLLTLPLNVKIIQLVALLPAPPFLLKTLDLPSFQMILFLNRPNTLLKDLISLLRPPPPQRKPIVFKLLDLISLLLLFLHLLVFFLTSYLSIKKIYKQIPEPLL